MKTFDPAKVVVTFQGQRILGPFGEGTFIVIKRNSQLYTRKTGADGEGARARSQDKSFIVEVTLGQASLSNDTLSDIANTDELSGGGVGVLQIEDLSGTTLFHSEEAWIQKYPDTEMGAELGERTWPFEGVKGEMYVGGNLEE